MWRERTRELGRKESRKKIKKRVEGEPREEKEKKRAAEADSKKIQQCRKIPSAEIPASREDAEFQLHLKGKGLHRFCLRHIRANFNETFKSEELKSLMWQAGIES
ncbi:hypothetical protein M9H77_03857 [Catharanthus roseus]|uniref:Uncharacterized protein n=1 Tax=Catharanthus roseus TaxID=4058 RepID=A0ACC0CCM4_CATRO|nr:hypothetical protein M9H77_03857 [Catharanthus roseus]